MPPQLQTELVQKCNLKIVRYEVEYKLYYSISTFTQTFSDGYAN